MDKIDQIISSKWMLTMTGNKLIEDHSIVIDGNTIKDILPTKDINSAYQWVSRIDLKEQLILPGLINNQVSSSILTVNGNSHLEKNYMMEYSKTNVKYMIAEMLKNGITTFSDVGLSPDISIEQVRQTNIRANIGLPIFKHKSFWADEEKEYLYKSLAIYDEYKSDPNIRLFFHLDSINKLSKNIILKISEIANELDIPVRMSLNTSQKEIDKCKSKYKLRPLQFLERIGLLSNTFTGMNVSIYNDADLNIMKKHKINIVNCMNAYIKSYNGIFTTKIFMDKDINVSLGTGDPILNCELNIIDEMKITGLLSKVKKIKKENIKSYELLKLITVNGVKSMGSVHKTGKLEIGKLADIISIKINAKKYNGSLDINMLQDNIKSSDIMNVWISGKHILKNKKLLTINEKLLYDKLVQLKKVGNQ